MSQLTQMDILRGAGIVKRDRAASDAVQLKIRNVAGQLFFVYMNAQKHIQLGIGMYGMDDLGIEYDQLIPGQGKSFLINADGDTSVQTEQNFHSIMPVHGNVRAFKRCHGNLNSQISHGMQGFCAIENFSLNVNIVVKQVNYNTGFPEETRIKYYL